MTNLPFKENSFDVIICSHLLEIAKLLDVKEDNVIDSEVTRYPTVEKVFSEMKRIIKNNKKIYVTTPNNQYYNSTKLTYDELVNAIKVHFEKFDLYFFNTHNSLGRKYRKFNLANTFPKIQGKFQDHSKILKSLIKNDSKKKSSVSFYIEILN